MKTKIHYFEVAAFTDRPFAGNPAGVCLLPDWLPDPTMQEIAAENNLAETAFVVDRGTNFDIRWMSPTVEVALCGHATLGSAHVLFQHLGHTGTTIRFQSQSGELTVERAGDRLVLDFPVQPLSECDPPENLAKSLGAKPTAVLKGRDYFAVFDREQEVAVLNPDFKMIAALDTQGVIVTAPGGNCDFVSRYFVPKVGIDEDPATGSTHCALIPYWSNRLNKRVLHARQLSKRGGEFFCEDRGTRVGIGGNAVTYLEGKIWAG